MDTFTRLQDICKANGTTPTALCKIITGSSGNLATWKKGNIRADYLQKIADYFNVSVDYLLTGQKEKAPQEIPEGLSELDAEIIKVCSTLPEEKKQQALSYLEFLHKQGGE